MASLVDGRRSSKGGRGLLGKGKIFRYEDIFGGLPHSIPILNLPSPGPPPDYRDIFSLSASSLPILDILVDCRYEHEDKDDEIFHLEQDSAAEAMPLDALSGVQCSPRVGNVGDSSKQTVSGSEELAGEVEEEEEGAFGSRSPEQSHFAEIDSASFSSCNSTLLVDNSSVTEEFQDANDLPLDDASVLSLDDTNESPSYGFNEIPLDANESPLDSANEIPFDGANGSPFDGTNESPFDANESPLDVANEIPFDANESPSDGANKSPVDATNAIPFDANEGPLDGANEIPLSADAIPLDGADESPLGAFQTQLDNVKEIQLDGDEIPLDNACETRSEPHEIPLDDADEILSADAYATRFDNANKIQLDASEVGLDNANEIQLVPNEIPLENADEIPLENANEIPLENANEIPSEPNEVPLDACESPLDDASKIPSPSDKSPAESANLSPIKKERIEFDLDHEKFVDISNADNGHWITIDDIKLATRACLAPPPCRPPPCAIRMEEGSVVAFSDTLEAEERERVEAQMTKESWPSPLLKTERAEEEGSGKEKETVYIFVQKGDVKERKEEMYKERCIANHGEQGTDSRKDSSRDDNDVRVLEVNSRKCAEDERETRGPIHVQERETVGESEQHRVSLEVRDRQQEDILNGEEQSREVTGSIETMYREREIKESESRAPQVMSEREERETQHNMEQVSCQEAEEEGEVEAVKEKEEGERATNETREHDEIGVSEREERETKERGIQEALEREKKERDRRELEEKVRKAVQGMEEREQELRAAQERYERQRERDGVYEGSEREEMEREETLCGVEKGLKLSEEGRAENGGKSREGKETVPELELEVSDQEREREARRATREALHKEEQRERERERERERRREMVREREREREKEREIEREREREREKDRIMLERAAQEATRRRAESEERATLEARVVVERINAELRTRAATEAKERAESEERVTLEARANAERINAELRKRAATEAKERAESEERVTLETRANVERINVELRKRAATEAKERAAKEKAAAERVVAEVLARAERAAAERAQAGAWQRAAEKIRGGRATTSSEHVGQRNENDPSSMFSAGFRGMKSARMTRGATAPSFDANQGFANEGQWRSSSGPKDSANPRASFFSASKRSNGTQNVEGGESEIQRKAWLDRQQRTRQRAEMALEEKNQRDLQSQREQAEKDRVADILDAEIKRWATGKEGNLRALLSTLQYVLWSNSGWQAVSLIDLVPVPAVKKAYKKAVLCIHPDKMQQKGATVHQKYIAEKVFNILQDARNKFNMEG